MTSELKDYILNNATSSIFDDDNLQFFDDEIDDDKAWNARETRDFFTNI